MTKQQSVYYVLAIAIVIIGVFLYTASVHAPHEVPEEDSLVNTEGNNSTPDTSAIEINEPAETLPVTVEGATAQPPRPLDTLSGTAWVWQYTKTENGTKVTIPEKTGAFIISFDFGSISSLTDCNTLGGQYETSAESIQFSQFFSTKMFCEDSQEAIYATQLSRVNSYAITNDTLELYLNGSGETMVFFSNIQSN